MNIFAPAQLLAEVEDVLRTMPPSHTFGNGQPPEHFAWLGRATAVISAWDSSKSTIYFEPAIAKMNSRFSKDVDEGSKTVLTVLHQARHSLRMQSVGPLTIAVGTGAVFDYFDEIRKVIETAKSEVFFVDPYLDAEFVSRYLPHTASGVSIKLLTNKCIPQLIPAVAQFRAQSGSIIEVRSATGFHDRYLFVDRTTCYHSGASFKDGAKKAPTTLTEIVDAFVGVLDIYEKLWSNGTPHP